MSGPIRLQDVPAAFFDATKWASLRFSAPSETTALCCLNARYPDPADPCDVFCTHGRSLNEAVDLYRTGRTLLNDYRLLLLNRKHVATGVGPDGKRMKIPAKAWINLWPLFATGRANGPGIIFNEIEICETDEHKLERTCVAWLVSRTDLTIQKKHAIYQDAKPALGNKLSHAIFDAAYKRVLGRKRGRPPTVQIKK